MGSATLLVIDDEPAITKLVSRAAESCGYEVFATSDPAAFKERFRSEPPDLICLDVVMPDIDGIELIRFLADEQCRSKLLIMSGSGPQLLHAAFSLAEALGLDVAGTLPKPLRIAAFKTILGDLARRPPPRNAKGPRFRRDTLAR
ncbi:MAG: hypothetical protein QOF34_1165 [Sphingomonadales bacterium]|nr:hypothetical protein [Sphingomonadales bacterium]